MRTYIVGQRTSYRVDIRHHLQDMDMEEGISLLCAHHVVLRLLYGNGFFFASCGESCIYGGPPPAGKGEEQTI